MRTPEEIVERVDLLQETPEADFFGAQRNDMIGFLPFEHARKYLKEGTTKEQWDKNRKEPTAENVKAEIEEYMPFAWMKANDMRGLSANRSIDHMKGFLWLLNDGSLEEMEKIEYEHYGKEKLEFVCEHLGLDWKQWDDGERTNG